MNLRCDVEFRFRVADDGRIKCFVSSPLFELADELPEIDLQTAIVEEVGRLRSRGRSISAVHDLCQAIIEATV